MIPYSCRRSSTSSTTSQDHASFRNRPCSKRLSIAGLALRLGLIATTVQSFVMVRPNNFINSSSSSKGINKNNNNNNNNNKFNYLAEFSAKHDDRDDMPTTVDNPRFGVLAERTTTTLVPPPSEDFVPKIAELLLANVNRLVEANPDKENVSPPRRRRLMGGEEAESVARTIVESMETKNRLFHSTKHLFHLLENFAVPVDPSLVLMVLFHDLIYHTVDGFFRDFQLELLEGVLVFDGDENDVRNENHHVRTNQTNTKPTQRTLSLPLTLSPRIAEEDPILGAVVAVYGLEAGKPLPRQGSNEFLSAVLATKILSEWLSVPDLLRVAAGIEATIPFRPVDADGSTATDKLYRNLRDACANLQATTNANTNAIATMDEEWLDRTLELSVELSHADLSSLSTSDPFFCLESTWSLLPESTPALLDQPDCPLAVYIDALGGLDGSNAFLLRAVPDMYPSFRGSPSRARVWELEDRTRSNLALGAVYSDARLLQVRVLEDLAVVAGADPNVLPARDLLRIGESTLLLASASGAAAATDSKNHQRVQEEDSFVVSLLSGNRTEHPWDPARCPLGEALYRILGKHGIERALAVGREQRARGSSGRLLRILPQQVVLGLATEAAPILGRDPSELVEAALGSAA
eukprot:CAMPEP_0172360588 /NCGR_PEP_ID=MMETSP1060-20121228/4589_1 /TAXON_ID=37318 /ORGANISM="Pseudo-nitzschia pungens, Strain cf. cingulata" /LENGTH=635 /DNA_ID=CAMNT_0013082625 /DNA_START=154 /DNA_END=2061 /DNA_ORIENTATION=+